MKYNLEYFAREVGSSEEYLAYLCIFLTPILYAVARIAAISAGNTRLELDFRRVWSGVASDVLNGVPLYLGGTGDNKPPLFHFVNILTGFF